MAISRIKGEFGVLRGAGLALALAGFGLGLNACGWGGGSSSAKIAASEAVGSVPSYNTAQLSLATAKPVDAYVMLAGRIKPCWFHPANPLFPKHVYRADVSPNGEKVKITIHDKKDDIGRPGKLAYTIDFKQSGDRTIVTAKNRTMTPEQAAKMQFDINRWKAGKKDCSKEWPKVAAQ